MQEKKTPIRDPTRPLLKCQTSSSASSVTILSMCSFQLSTFRSVPTSYWRVVAEQISLDSMRAIILLFYTLAELRNRPATHYEGVSII